MVRGKGGWGRDERWGERKNGLEMGEKEKEGRWGRDERWEEKVRGKRNEGER